MKKVKLFLFVIIITPIICAVFGIIHDQITYSISHEYFTKFKFIQFGFIDDYGRALPDDRIIVGMIGVLATWWVGIPIGIIYGIILLFFENDGSLYRLYFKTICLTFIITILTSIVGFLYGRFYLQNVGVNWYLPDNLIDTKSFICVGSIHNFSYLGGTFGLMAGTLYLVVLRGKRSQSTKTLKLRK